MYEKLQNARILQLPEEYPNLHDWPKKIFFTNFLEGRGHVTPIPRLAFFCDVRSPRLMTLSLFHLLINSFLIVELLAILAVYTCGRAAATCTVVYIGKYLL